MRVKLREICRLIKPFGERKNLKRWKREIDKERCLREQFAFKKISREKKIK